MITVSHGDNPTQCDECQHKYCYTSQRVHGGLSNCGSTKEKLCRSCGVKREQNSSEQGIQCIDLFYTDIGQIVYEYAIGYNFKYMFNVKMKYALIPCCI